MRWSSIRCCGALCASSTAFASPAVFICLESWLNDRAEPDTRGTILGAYMVALYSGQALGQLLLQAEATPATPFQIASILITLAIIPICLTRSAAPVLAETASLSIGRLYSASPLGVAGAAITGLMLGAFYGLAAIYARRIGLEPGRYRDLRDDGDPRRGGAAMAARPAVRSL